MRVALGQLDMVWENQAASLKKAEEMVAEAARGKCDLIVFPEMAFTGFSVNLDKVGEEAACSATKGEVMRMAQAYGIGIAYGWAALPSPGEKKGRNLFTLISARGEEVGEYAKLHPFSYGREHATYRPGEQVVTFPYLGRQVAMFICYDLRFPEIFHIAAREADVMLVIANWPAIRSAHWQTLLRARAIETQSYVVGVNCVGQRDGDFYSGDSMAVDCIGNILGQISGREGVLICELEDRAWRLREKFATAKDRREELYSSYYR